MAQVKTLVRPTAQHIRITSLAQGDVYKRVVKEYQEHVVVFGVVTDVLANDEDAAVIAVEYKLSYSDVDAKIVTFEGDSTVAIFPAEPEEVRTYFAELAESAERKVRAKERELVEAKRRTDAINQVLNGELHSPEYTAITA